MAGSASKATVFVHLISRVIIVSTNIAIITVIIMEYVSTIKLWILRSVRVEMISKVINVRLKSVKIIVMEMVCVRKYLKIIFNIIYLQKCKMAFLRLTDHLLMELVKYKFADVKRVILDRIVHSKFVLIQRYFKYLRTKIKLKLQQLYKNKLRKLN